MNRDTDIIIIEMSCLNRCVSLSSGSNVGAIDALNGRVCVGLCMKVGVLKLE